MLQLQLLCKIRSNTHILLFSHFFIWGENNWRGIQMLKLWGKCALNFIIELIFKRSSLFWDSNLEQIVWISKTPTKFSVQDGNCIMKIFINPGIFIKIIVTYPMNLIHLIQFLNWVDYQCLQFVNLHPIQSFILTIACLVNPEHVSK